MNRAFILITSLFSFIIFLHFPTTGHDILLTPFNIFLWEICAVSTFIAGLYIYKNQEIIIPRHAFFILLLPIGMIISGFISGQTYPTNWMFRLAAILMGLIFFFSLFQFQVKRRTLDNAIYIIIFGMLISSIISFLQVLPGQPLFGFIPHPSTPKAVGVFMQPNLLASSLVTAILLCIYQISTPSFINRSPAIKALCFLTLFCASVIVISSGSRVGIIGLLIALPILLFSRNNLLSSKGKYYLFSIITLFSGCTLGFFISEGAIYALSKIENLATGGSEIRIHIYKISWSLFIEKPFFGHGLGSFQTVFHAKAAEYMANHDSTPLIGYSRYSHPHNELLFWAIEGGLLALAGLISAVFVTFLQAKRLGRERGLALLALIIPIALHTQTELPFYSSIYHWILFIFLVFMLFNSLSRKIDCSQFKSTIIAVPAIGTSLLVATVIFCTSTFWAARSLTQFLLYKEVNMEDFRNAKENLYFNEYGTLLYLKVLLNQDITDGTRNWTLAFIEWNEDFLTRVPEVSTFHDLALAYNHLGMRQKANDVIQRGLYMYPEQPVIMAAIPKINRIPTISIEKALDQVLSPSPDNTNRKSSITSAPLILK